MLRIFFLSFLIFNFIGCGGGGGSSGQTNNPPSAKISNVNNNSTFNEGVNITFKANTSTDKDGIIIKYEWYENDNLLYTGETFSIGSLSVGRHTITLKITDDKGESSSDKISVTIKSASSANRMPIAISQNITTNQNTSINITLSGNDADGDSLTYMMVSHPANGGINGKIPNLTYTPNNGYVGNDSFVFKVNDGKVDSNYATINIQVKATNLNLPTGKVNDGVGSTEKRMSIIINLDNFV